MTLKSALFRVGCRVHKVLVEIKACNLRSYHYSDNGAVWQRAGAPANQARFFLGGHRMSDKIQWLSATHIKLAVKR